MMGLSLVVVGTSAASEGFPPRTSSRAPHPGLEGQVLRGRDGWLFFAPEIRHLEAGVFWGEAAAAVSRARRPDAVDPLPVIQAFHQALAERGVHLLMVPVPGKATIHPDRLPEGLSEHGWDGEHARFYALLRRAGVDVLDLTDHFRSRREHPQGPLYCREDSHWSPVGCLVAAERIAEAVLPYLDPPSDPLAVEMKWDEIEIQGDLRRLLARPDGAPERLAIPHVRSVQADGTRALISPDPHSPVVLLGDSHALVFHAGGDMHAQGAGLADHVAAHLLRPLDLVAVRGSGATPARINLFRRAQQNPGYWEGKSVVIWCFSVREFTQSDGWRMVPIEP